MVEPIPIDSKEEFSHEKLLEYLIQANKNLEDPDITTFTNVMLEFMKSFAPLGMVMSFAFSGLPF
jgi:hypothetical protein